VGGWRVGLLGGGVLGWSVDPGGVAQIEDLRRVGRAEAVRVSGAGLRQYRAPVGGFVGGQPEVHIGGGVQPDAGVTMLVVVPVGEGIHELPCLGK
jgi:hypothetical protein